MIDPPPPPEGIPPVRRPQQVEPVEETKAKVKGAGASPPPKVEDKLDLSLEHEIRKLVGQLNAQNAEQLNKTVRNQELTVYGLPPPPPIDIIL